MITVRSITLDRFMFCGECVFNTPPQTKPVQNGVSRNVSNLFPLCQSELSTFVRHNMVITSIVLLILACSPYAVFGAVPQRIIFSFYGVLGCWTSAHVLNKEIKNHPAFTQCNPSSAVIFVRLVRGICASLFHGIPNTVFWRSFTSVCHPVLGPGTATRLTGVPEVINSYVAYGSTVTPAGDVIEVTDSPGLTNYYPQSESGTNHRNVHVLSILRDES